MIDTDRLHLVPFTPEMMRALIVEPERFEDLAGFPVAAGLHELFASGEVSPDFLARLRTLEHADPWQLGFAIVHPESGCVMGSAGFKGAPDPAGVVEVAYGIAPGFEGRGFATEATNALVDFAFATESVHTVRAHTLPAPNASTRVLVKCRFQYTGEVVDPEDGPVWRWERPR